MQPGREGACAQRSEQEDEKPVTTRKQLEAQLIDRAMQDDAFRQELVRNPRGVFARELSVRIPEHITVQVLEESPTTVYLVLPPLVAQAGAELADAELEEVAGGLTADTCRGLTCSREECGSLEVSCDFYSCIQG